MKNSSHPKRILLLLGRKSRRGAENQELIKAALKEKGLEILNESAEDSALEAQACIRKYAAQAEAVVVGGGDGSVCTILPALVETQLPFCVIPLGTANNLARTMELPKDSLAALALLWEGDRRKIDLGCANGVYFVNVAGIGLSARINTSTPSHWKKWLGPFAFILTALRLARSMVPFRAWIECDGKMYEGKSLQISVCNGKYFGTGLKIAEHASLTDGALMCISVEVKRWWQAFFLLPSFLKADFETPKSVQYMEGKSIRVRTKRPMKVDLDGDIRTHTPLEINVLRESVEMFCPFLPLAPSVPSTSPAAAPAP